MTSRPLRSFALLLLAVLPLVGSVPGCRKRPAGLPAGEEADLKRPAEEWLRQEPVRLLRDYVRIDTTAEKGERAGVEFLRDLFECDGIANEIVCPAPGRCNILARLPGRHREGALLLLNHVDVAEAYPTLWKEAPPFEGRIKLGFLYGRGSYDMKSLGLAQALAMRQIKRLGIVPDSDILFLGEADEESDQRWGSRWLLEHRPEWFGGVANVLNEGGTNEMILRDVRYWGLETVQAGFGLVQLESIDRKALASLAERWKKVKSDPVPPHPHAVLAFAILANHLGHPLTDPLRHLDRVQKDPRELAILPDRYGSFLESRVYWSPVFLFPQTRKFREYAVVSTPPGVAPDGLVEGIAADATKSGLAVIGSSTSGAAPASPYPTPFTDLLRDVTGAQYPGVPFGPMPMFGGSTTSIYFRRRNIPAYGFSPLPANISDSVRRHGNDERIFLRDYVNGVSLFGEVLLQFALDPGHSLTPEVLRK